MVVHVPSGRCCAAAPASDALFGSLSPRNPVENARAALISAIDEAAGAVPRAPLDLFWALTNAGRAQALHARLAAGASPVARAYRLMPEASLVFEALLSARRRGFPARHVPGLVANRIGYVPGPPVAWALLAEAAGIAETKPLRVRADAWRKRLAWPVARAA